MIKTCCLGNVLHSLHWSISPARPGGRDGLRTGPHSDTRWVPTQRYVSNDLATR
jgi:hypothetical protein